MGGEGGVELTGCLRKGKAAQGGHCRSRCRHSGDSMGVHISDSKEIAANNSRFWPPFVLDFTKLGNFLMHLSKGKAQVLGATLSNTIVQLLPRVQ